MSASPIVFDAYGTLFDVYAVSTQAEAFFPGRGQTLAELWRTAQIDYTRLRALGGKYADFWTITRDALVFAGASMELELTTGHISSLMGAYQQLTLFPENLEVLRTLKSRGHMLGILSNGTASMLSDAILSSGLKGMFTHILSADAVRSYKPAQDVYALAPEAFEVMARDIVFVSSNSWDICGAGWYGFQTFWVNRGDGVLDMLGTRPGGEGRNLRDLLGFI